MAQSSNSNRSSGGNRNRNRSRGGRGRGGNRNRGGKGQGSGGNRGRSSRKSGGGGGSRGFIKQKVPRRTKPLTWWEKLLNVFGLGPKRRKPPQPSTPRREGNAAASLRAASTDPNPPKKKAARKRPERDRKPEKVAVSNTRLHVGNLSYDTTDSDLAELFGKIGPVASSEVVSHGRSGRSKGFAFVEMEHLEDAKRAAEELHDLEFMGRPITVGGAKSAKPGS